MEKAKPKVEIYLYDADGTDVAITLEDVNTKKLDEKKLLWINVWGRNKETIESVASVLQIEDVPVKSILDVSERPKIDKFVNFYRFFVVSVCTDNDGKLIRVPIDFVVGENFVVTIHDEKVDYFDEFRECEKGETQIGELDAESFVATLLDLHIVYYFRALEKIEQKIDKIDEKVLKRDLDEEKFLHEVVELRHNASKLRRWFLPHRDVFYAFSRSDFKQIAESDSVEQFKMLNHHFESAVDAIEHSRETIISVFELYATKNAHRMNNAMQRLTFVTLVAGTLGVIAGTFGMNFEVEYFKSAETGFWLTIAGMAILIVTITILAKFKRWI